jgi:manganese/zinc/iron transport system permease protein
VERAGGDGEFVRLTPAGLDEAARVTRNHRLWELFLITHADIAPSHVDRDADQIEHVLAPTMIRELESLLDAGETLPSSPHVLATVGTGPGAATTEGGAA